MDNNTSTDRHLNTDIEAVVDYRRRQWRRGEDSRYQWAPQPPQRPRLRLVCRPSRVVSLKGEDAAEMAGAGAQAAIESRRSAAEEGPGPRGYLRVLDGPSDNSTQGGAAPWGMGRFGERAVPRLTTLASNLTGESFAAKARAAEIEAERKQQNILMAMNLDGPAFDIQTVDEMGKRKQWKPLHLGAGPSRVDERMTPADRDQPAGPAGTGNDAGGTVFASLSMPTHAKRPSAEKANLIAQFAHRRQRRSADMDTENQPYSSALVSNPNPSKFLSASHPATLSPLSSSTVPSQPSATFIGRLYTGPSEVPSLPTPHFQFPHPVHSLTAADKITADIVEDNLGKDVEMPRKKTLEDVEAELRRLGDPNWRSPRNYKNYPSHDKPAFHASGPKVPESPASGSQKSQKSQRPVPHVNLPAPSSHGYRPPSYYPAVRGTTMDTEYQQRLAAQTSQPLAHSGNISFGSLNSNLDLNRPKSVEPSVLPAPTVHNLVSAGYGQLPQMAYTTDPSQQNQVVSLDKMGRMVSHVAQLDLSGHPGNSSAAQTYGYSNAYDDPPNYRPHQNTYTGQEMYLQQNAHAQQDVYPQQIAYPQQNSYSQQSVYSQQNAYSQPTVRMQPNAYNTLSHAQAQPSSFGQSNTRHQLGSFDQPVFLPQVDALSQQNTYTACPTPVSQPSSSSQSAQAFRPIATATSNPAFRPVPPEKVNFLELMHNKIGSLADLEDGAFGMPKKAERERLNSVHVKELDDWFYADNRHDEKVRKEVAEAWETVQKQVARERDEKAKKAGPSSFGAIGEGRTKEAQDAAEKRDKEAKEMMENVWLPLFATLKSYSDGPPEYWKKNWTKPPEWAMDHSPAGRQSYFGEKWGTPPARIGRDPRYRSFQGVGASYTSPRPGGMNSPNRFYQASMRNLQSPAHPKHPDDHSNSGSDRSGPRVGHHGHR